MITIIRLNRITEDNAVFPAGEIWYFRGEQEVEHACTFMWGRDINDYIMFRNGFRIEMDSDLYSLANILKEYK